MHPLPQPERRFFGDAVALNSFGQNASASAPPSLKANSFKPRNAVIMKLPTIVRRRRAQSSDFNYSWGMKDKDFNTPSPDIFIEHQDLGPSPVLCQGAENNNTYDGQKKSDTYQRKPKRSMTIMKLFSSKRRTQSPPIPTQPIPCASTQSNTGVFGSKENREMALRERGLLPTLKPNADLSIAEWERDRLLPVLPTPPSNSKALTLESGETTKVSAALRVKYEWEAKQMATRHELERMKSFTFGGSASSLVQNNDVSPLMASVVRPIEHVTSVQPEGLTLTSGVMNATSLSIATKRSMPALVLQLDGPDTRESTGRTFSSHEPYLIPLPPSPSPFLRSPRSREELAAIALAASFPLPPSPGLNVPQHSPTISLTPPSTSSPTPVQHYHQKSTSRSLSSAESCPHPYPATIVESPTQECPTVEESIIKGSIIDRHTEPTAANATVPDGRAVSEMEDFNSSTERRCNSTDATVGGLKVHRIERQKSFNPFKRNHALPPTPSVVSPPTTSRRLSMSASLSNMRRSVIGTLSRPKASGLAVKVEKGFDASHLPPSPTIAAFFAQDASSSPITPNSSLIFQQQQQHRPAPPEAKTRIAVSPTLYSRGSIVAETSNIEDEETRRMTELAFLG